MTEFIVILLIYMILNLYGSIVSIVCFDYKHYFDEPWNVTVDAFDGLFDALRGEISILELLQFLFVLVLFIILPFGFLACLIGLLISPFMIFRGIINKRFVLFERKY